ncbi:hypothetical protein OAF65_10095 [Verrucomicrobiales bacterium]|nr:hypothetical protein [Verrucomicrobiales bacterium]MDB4722058.1 hypothetical protein [Verrucomicrobiales bacterium]
MKTFFTATIASVALAGIAAAGTVNFSNFGSTWEIQASGTPINGGFVSVGTTGVSDFSDAAAAQTALAADFTAFGASTDFGGAAAFNIDGFFSGVAQGDGGAAAFDGKNIIIVGGDGADIATSSHLFVIDTGAPFAADAPLFAASVDINTGAKLGAAGGTAVAAGVAGAFQAAAVGVVIPEPGVSVLALFAAGFLALRRRR